MPRGSVSLGSLSGGTRRRVYTRRIVILDDGDGYARFQRSRCCYPAKSTTRSTVRHISATIGVKTVYHSAIPAISRARRPYINDNARPAKRRGSPGLERRRESARTCTHAHVCTARAYRRAHSHANTHPHVLRSFRLRHRRVFVLPSLRHENAHAVSYMQRDLRDRVRSIAASTGKWHLNPSIISHVIPLPG